MNARPKHPLVGVKQWEPPSAHALRERIRAIRRISLAAADIDFLKDRLSLLFRGYVVNTPVLTSGQVLFRGVLWRDRPRLVHQLSYPPADVVREAGRANRVGQSMFYASVARSAPFYELGVKKGDKLALSRWRVSDKILVNNVGFTKGVFQVLGSRRLEPPDWGKAGASDLISSSGPVHEFLAQ